MQWSDLEALLEYGHTIGGHTKRHTRLSNGVSEDELHEELFNSAIYIEKKLGNEVEHFAFTFGDIDSISLDALSVASKKFKYIYSGIRGDNFEVASPITIRRDAAAFLDSSYKYVPFKNNLLSSFLGGAADFNYKEPRKRIDSWSQLIRNGYDLLKLNTFFTSGPEESRAWTIKKNTTAPKAAAVIHSDFEKKFIKAEAVSCEDFIKFGSAEKCKENGKLRIEGKDYLVKDGDVLHFRVNS